MISIFEMFMCVKLNLLFWQRNEGVLCYSKVLTSKWCVLNIFTSRLESQLLKTDCNQKPRRHEQYKDELERKTKEV